MCLFLNTTGVKKLFEGVTVDVDLHIFDYSASMNNFEIKSQNKKWIDIKCVISIAQSEKTLASTFTKQ